MIWTLWTPTLLISTPILPISTQTHDWLSDLMLATRGPVPSSHRRKMGLVPPLRVYVNRVVLMTHHRKMGSVPLLLVLSLKIWLPLLIYHRKMGSVPLLRIVNAPSLVGSLVRSPLALCLTMVLILPMLLQMRGLILIVLLILVTVV